MEAKLKNLTIIDLISEKHIILRREVQERWAEYEEEVITHNEAMLLAKISQERISLAEVARQANISRQAMFKCAKKLEEKGYLRFVNDEVSGKYTELTKQGEEYCKKSRELKENIEREIADRIGEDVVDCIKEYLLKDWVK
ncbi:putative transcriptional regulator, MarR family [Lachnospiraceae bacterium KM106-2]|nr:putative transcriptional regulator, MarR family [Lachnospiraceae bacterium KM106-2]